MKNDSRITKAFKPDTAGKGTTRPFSKRSGEGVGRSALDAEKMGAGNTHPTRRNARPAMADPVSGAKAEAESSLRLSATERAVLSELLADMLLSAAGGQNRKTAVKKWRRESPRFVEDHVSMRPDERAHAEQLKHMHDTLADILERLQEKKPTVAPRWQPGGVKLELEIKSLSQLNAVLVQIEAGFSGDPRFEYYRGEDLASAIESEAREGLCEVPVDTARMIPIYKQLVALWPNEDTTPGRSSDTEWQREIMQRYNRLKALAA